MKIKDGYIVKDIVGNVVVIPIGQTQVNGANIIKLNNNGAFFIRNIISEKTKEDIVDLYADLYSEDLDDAREEYDKFIDFAVKSGFLELSKNGEEND